MDLICADDLRSDTVRRRAVFHWTDTARIGTVLGYTVQKVAPSGATHVPDPA